MRSKIVNVDDVGMSTDSNHKIYSLGIKGKINSISCFVEGEIMPKASVMELRENANFRVGIHLNLTEFRNKDLGIVIKDLIFGRLTSQNILDDFSAQLKLFIDIYGFFPSHFDSHQHVHQLPIVRWALAELIRKNRNNLSEGFYVRCTDVPLIFMIRKFLFIAPRTLMKNIGFKFIGASFKHYAHKSNISVNRYLLGTYSFNINKNYSQLLSRFMEFNFSSDDLFYCHPGGAGNDMDIIASERIHEYEAINNLDC